MIRTKPLTRRRLLRGSLAGGASIAIGLPLLEAMLDVNGERLAHGQALPRRFGVFFFGNGRGVEAAKWRPTGTGAGWTPSPLLAPLAGIKDYVSVVTGMNAKLDKSPQGHHKGSAAILSGYDFITQPANNAPYRSTFAKPSIDQLAAQAIGTGSAFKSLEIGMSKRVINGEGTTIQYISHNGPDSGNPPELSPRNLFNRLFAGAAAVSGPAAAPDPVRGMRKSILDAVLDDLGALEQRVGTADRARLDQHAESIRAIERRLSSESTAAPASCAPAQAPADPTGASGKEPIEERMQAMGDLLALALSCDRSRVFSIQFSGSAGGPVFWQVGADRSHHDISHDGAAGQALMEAITIFTMKQLAGLLTKFRDTPDGAGNLLDSMALLATSDHSDGAGHTVNDYPVIVAGRAGGALVHPGVHYTSSGEHTNKVLLSILRAVGVQLAELGMGSYRQTAGVSALET
ncbi:MAG TPA: DUF1552 domain-containing protein [Polyangiales bacterium]|nr:DUF1552 domain-containing protein [Polyangiales bacterium]